MILSKLIINSLNKFLNIFDIQIIKKSFLEKLLRNQLETKLLKRQKKSRSNFIENLELSKSQLRQDLFVLSELNFKKNGFFVDFGATNGFDISNCYLLEKKFNWNGILAEPARKWHRELLKNREVNIDRNCVWSETGKELTFNEVNDAKLSTIDQFSSSDQHKELRKNGNQ